ncbi:hypothetical protein [Muricoccus vinaceus]|uniref:CopG-like ribbon-helix-helix domain-containing protein n=1 Tax=Muricoccus vinaceus TaxID=424704 RepID=A0ABV6IZ97_9PROT
MTEMRIELPPNVAEALEQRAVELGTTSDQLLTMVVVEAVTERPDDEDWKFR